MAHLLAADHFGAIQRMTYQGQSLSNWWDVFYNWDEVIQSSGDLVKRINARKGEGNAEGNFPVCTHAGLRPVGRWEAITSGL